MDELTFAQTLSQASKDAPLNAEGGVQQCVHTRSFQEGLHQGCRQNHYHATCVWIRCLWESHQQCYSPSQHSSDNSGRLSRLNLIRPKFNFTFYDMSEVQERVKGQVASRNGSLSPPRQRIKAS